MARFKKGDVVRCINASGLFNVQMAVGHVYTIIEADNHYVRLGGLSGYWHSSRFERAASTATTGEALKARGQAAAARRSGSEWVAGTLNALRQFCLDQYKRGVTRITVDEFRAERRVAEPESLNAWGALPKAAAKAGFLRDTGMAEKATRTTARARLVKVWAIQPRAL